MAGSRHVVEPNRLALAGLVVLVVALFPDLLLGGRVLYERDISIVWEPQVQAFVRAVTTGSLPLWDPHVSFGHPMLANPNSQVLYPFTWLNLVLAPGAFYTVYALAHLIAAGLGLFLLARRLTLSPPAAFLAAAAYVASGPLLSLVDVWHHLAGAALLPWVCLAAERALSSGRLLHAVVWGLVLGLSVVAGSPDYTLLSGIVVAVWTLVHFAPDGEVRRLRIAILAGVALVVALGVSAAQWLPSLAVAADSARWALDPALRMPASLSVVGLLELVSAVPWTELPIAPALRGPLYGGGEPFLHAVYLGVPVLALAALALAGPRRPRRGLLAGLAVAFTLFALGLHGPVYGLALKVMPLLRSIRYPSKALVVVAFALALLAGMGFETWQTCGAGRRLRLLAAGLALAGLAGLAAAGLAFQPRLLAGLLLDERTLGATWGETLRPFGLRIALAAGLWLALAALAAWQQTARAARLAPAVLALVVLDLGLANRTVNTTAPSDIFRYRPPLADLLQHETLARVFVYRYPLRPAPPHPALSLENPYRIAWFPAGYDVHSGQMLAARLYPMPPVGAAFGLSGSYDPDLLGLYPRHLAALVNAMAAAEGTAAYARYLRLGAVTHVVALHERGFEDLLPERELRTPFVLPVRVFGVGGTLPRTYVVGRARLAEGEEALRVLVDPSFDPTREIVLPPGTPLAAGGDAPAPAATDRRDEASSLPAAGTSRIVQARADRILLEAQLTTPGSVVLVETHDPGWRATVDGRPADVLRANVAFRAVAVAAGRHVIELLYRPRWVIVGGWVSGAALMSSLALLAAGRRRAQAAKEAKESAGSTR
jgi:hypothetical protein